MATLTVNWQYIMNDRDIALRLSKVLKKLEIEHNSPPNETGVKLTHAGIIVLYVNNNPLEYFFDEVDLIEWLEKQDVG